MNDRYSLGQIVRFVVVVLCFAVIITMLTANLLNVARTGAEAEKTNYSSQIPKQQQ